MLPIDHYLQAKANKTVSIELESETENYKLTFQQFNPMTGQPTESASVVLSLKDLKVQLASLELQLAQLKAFEADLLAVAPKNPPAQKKSKKGN